MKTFLVYIVIPVLLLAQAQFRPVSLLLTHEWIVAIVPMVGAGTAKDPKKPMFSDLPGLLGFTAELSDDGRFAFVEFAAKERSQLDTLVNSGQRLARKDSAAKDAIYEEFKQYKRTFNPQRFGVAIP